MSYLAWGLRIISGTRHVLPLEIGLVLRNALLLLRSLILSLMSFSLSGAMFITAEYCRRVSFAFFRLVLLPAIIPMGTRLGYTSRITSRQLKEAFEVLISPMAMLSIMELGNTVASPNRRQDQGGSHNGNIHDGNSAQDHYVVLFPAGMSAFNYRSHGDELPVSVAKQIQPANSPCAH